MSNTNTVTSGLSKMRPHATYDTATGEQLSEAEHDEIVTLLLNYVQAETQRLFTTHTEELYMSINNAKTISNANSFGRKHGYTSDYHSLPRSIKAKSRINELVLQKLITETASWVNSNVATKQAPTFNSTKINLGAVDKQMISMSFSKEDSVLSLKWKVWDKELLIEFRVPDYVSKRNVHKWCLPTVQVKNGEVYYYFAVQERVENRGAASQVAGIDLGRSKAYHIGVVNKSGERIADYSPRGIVESLNTKRENLLKEKASIMRKVQHYEVLGIFPGKQQVLRREAKCKAGKAFKLGGEVAWQSAADITKKLEKHDLNTVVLEDLKWVSGSKYGSRWNHSVQQQAIEHSLSRRGVRVSKRNPKGTSQECYKCGTRLVHRTRKRTVWCEECKSELDRDFNSALKLAGKGKSTIRSNGSARYSRSGGDCSTSNTVQVMGNDSSLPPVNNRSG